jgi:3'-5' exoribonuclease
MKNHFIKDLKPGDTLDSVFILVKKTLKKTKNGQDYCVLSFQDNSGSIDGIVWTEACQSLGLFKKGNFEEGDYVKVQGSVSDYKGTRQLDINRLMPLSEEEKSLISYEDFVKSSKRNAGQMFEELQSIISGFKNLYLRQLIESFFSDPVFKKNFCFWPAAAQYHHAYIGGLLEHTLSMVKICAYLANCYENIDRDLLITGAVLHDIGKITEYGTEKNGAIIKITDEGKLLGHITIGYGIVLEKIKLIKDFPKDLEKRLLHIILAHHGHKEFGSPKRPKTLEAFIVYHVDHMDADIGGFNFILESSDSEAQWSEYLKNYERSVYLKSPDYPGSNYTQEQNGNNADTKNSQAKDVLF